MRLAFGLAFATLGAGCDHLLQLEPITPLRDGRAADALGDGASRDVPLDAAACPPTTFTGTPQQVGSITGVAELALAGPQTSLIGVATKPGDTHLYVLASLAAGLSDTGVSILAPVSPAIRPDGNELFVAAGGVVYHSFNSGTSWGPLITISALPASSLPGVPFQPIGALDMMLALSDGTLEEWTRSNTGTWTQAGLAYAPPSGTAVDPSLSSDGLSMVYIVANSSRGDDGVWYSTRSSTANGFATTYRLFAANNIASPHLDEDCRTLYFVNATTNQLVSLAR